MNLVPLRPIPTPSVRPWAGSRLAPAGEHVGELWLAGPASRCRVDGLDQREGGPTLDELAALHGEALVGSAGMARYGARFPLLAKLIDAADWLSLQVHPDDALARDMFGPAAVGKAEAWVVLDAEPGAELVTGPADGLAHADLLVAIEAGEAGHDHCKRTTVTRGDTLMLQPGTLHAIGPGTLVYELEQPSDITFRISDWGRTGRQLHVAESARALAPERQAEPAGTCFQLDGGRLASETFHLEFARTPMERRPAGRTPDVVTALVGSAAVRGPGWTHRLEEWETIVVPAAVEAYELLPRDGAIVAIGSLP